MLDLSASWIALAYSLWLARIGIIFILAVSHKLESRQKNVYAQHPQHPRNSQPFVSIIIPAFNEQDCIQSAISSCLKSSYRNFEIIVVDDGSSDNTAAQILTLDGIHLLSHFRLLQHSHNKGKAHALNSGLDVARGSIVVTLDADTRFEKPETLEQLIAPLLYDQKLSAVTGCLRVSQPSTTWGLLQDMEYTNVLQMIKRAQCKLNAIMILPGAMSAFRLTDLQDSGNFSPQTIAEDADITMQLLVNGKKSIFVADVIALTETPNTLKSLFRQRIRWRVGQLQCLNKHKTLLRSGQRIKLIYLDIIVTNIFSLISPVMLFALTFFTLHWGHQSIQTAIISLLGIIGVGWATTAVCYWLSNRNCPAPASILGYIIFFSVFNPVISLIAMVYFTRSKKPQWRKMNVT